MSWKKTADVVAVVGKYEANGGEKNRYLNCGIVLTNEKGQQSVKLTCIPFKDDGTIASFLSIYPLKDKPQQQQRQPSRGRDELDDEIPNF